MGQSCAFCKRWHFLFSSSCIANSNFPHGCFFCMHLLFNGVYFHSLSIMRISVFSFVNVCIMKLEAFLRMADIFIISSWRIELFINNALTCNSFHLKYHLSIKWNNLSLCYYLQRYILPHSFTSKLFISLEFNIIYLHQHYEVTTNSLELILCFLYFQILLDKSRSISWSWTVNINANKEITMIM